MFIYQKSKKNSEMILDLIFHMLAVILTGFGIFYEFNYVNFQPSEFQWHQKFGGKFKFLSVQNMFVQFAYFFLAFLYDLLNGCLDPSTMKSLRIMLDDYFSSLAFPLALFISLNFWILYITKRDTIFPKIFDRSVPIWHLHILHTNVSIFVLTEMFIRFRQFPDLCSGLTTILTFMSCYILWLNCIKYFAGFWVYPLLNDKSFKELYTYFGSALLQMIIIYMLCEILNNATWSYELVHKNCGRQNKTW